MRYRPDRNQVRQSGPIRQALTVVCLTAFFVTGCTSAPDQADKEKDAKNKAALEEKASAQSAKATPTETITKEEAQAVDPAGKEPLDDAITCLARTIYWEARNAGVADMEAIANVVMNRLGHEGFPSTICEIVKQGQEQGACQFSWWCDGRPDTAQDEKSYAVAKEIARRALNRELKDPTRGALYFHGKGSTPRWSKEIYQNRHHRPSRILQAAWRQGEMSSTDCTDCRWAQDNGRGNLLNTFRQRLLLGA